MLVEASVTPTLPCGPIMSLYKKMKFYIKDFFSKFYERFGYIYWRNS